MQTITTARGPRAARAGLSLAVVVLTAALVAACGATGTSATPKPTAAPASAAAGTSGTGSGGTGTAACATAPSPPANLPGWTAAAKTGGVIPQIITSQLACGKNRLLFGFTQQQTDSTGQPQLVSVGSPDRTAKVALFNLARDPNTATMTVDATFMWAIEGVSGLYVAPIAFPEAGEWGAAFTTAKAGGTPETVKVRFEVQDTGVMPGIGAKVPSVKTPTLSDPGVDNDPHRIASDPSPDPRFYQVSEDQALSQHKPFVLVFATPAFCQSQVCGPTLDKVKAIIGQYPQVTFINVEPYVMQYLGGRLQPVLSADGQLQPNAASNAFSLLSEPWIYVVDGNGLVTGSFETLAGPDELKAAIEAASKS